MVADFSERHDREIVRRKRAVNVGCDKAATRPQAHHLCASSTTSRVRLRSQGLPCPPYARPNVSLLVGQAVPAVALTAVDVIQIGRHSLPYKDHAAAPNVFRKSARLFGSAVIGFSCPSNSSEM